MRKDKEAEKEYQHMYYLLKTKDKRAKIRAELKIESVCPICGKTFIAVSRRQKYCSIECKKEAAKKQEAIKRQDPVYMEKFKAKRKEYYKSEKYKEVRRKYAKTEKFKEAQNRYHKKLKQTKEGLKRLKEINKRASLKYRAKKRELEAKTICPICKKEFIRNKEHRKYCSIECRNKAHENLIK